MVQGNLTLSISNTELLVFNIILPMISAGGVATNVIVILGMYYDKSLRRAVSNVFVLNLAIADILVLVVGVPLWIVQLVLAKTMSVSDGMISCQITFGLTAISSVLSIYTLGVISYDRHLAVTKPFQYNVLMSPHKSYCIIAGLWAVAIATSLPTFIGWKSTKFYHYDRTMTSYCAYTRAFREEYLLVSFSAISLLIILTIIVYARLLKVAKKHARQIHTVENELQTVKDEHCRERTLSTTMRPIQKNLKAARTLGIILGALIICWVPFLIVCFIDILRPDMGISLFTVKMLGTVTYLNSIMDPIVYTYMSRDFRRTIRKLLRRQRSSFQGNGSGSL